MPRIVAGAFGRRAPRNDEDRETFPTRRDVEDAHVARTSPLIPLMTLANGAGEGAVDDRAPPTVIRPSSPRQHVVVSEENHVERRVKSHDEKLPPPHEPPRHLSLCITMNYSTAPIAMNSNELSNAMRDVVMATHDPAKLGGCGASPRAGKSEKTRDRRREEKPRGGWGCTTALNRPGVSTSSLITSL